MYIESFGFLREGVTWAGPGGSVRLRFAFTAVVGDMPFQGHLFKFRRHFTANNICPWCMCHKDHAGDVRDNAAWLPGIDTAPLPWDPDTPPQICTVPGLERPFASKPDIFHIGHLGVCRDLYLGIIICLAVVFKHFGCQRGMMSLNARLASAYDLFKLHCNLCGASPFAKSWSRDNFHFAAGSYPDCSFKASDSYLILKWLEDYLSARPWADPDGVLGMMLSAVVGVNEFYRACLQSEQCT